MQVAENFLTQFSLGWAVGDEARANEERTPVRSLRKVSFQKSAVFRQVDRQLAANIDGYVCLLYSATEYVPATAPVLTDEVKVIARQVNALGILGKPESHHRPRRLSKVNHNLIFQHLFQRRLGWLLARLAASLEALEAPFDFKGVKGVLRG